MNDGHDLKKQILDSMSSVYNNNKIPYQIICSELAYNRILSFCEYICVYHPQKPKPPIKSYTKTTRYGFFNYKVYETVEYDNNDYDYIKSIRKWEYDIKQQSILKNKLYGMDVIVDSSLHGYDFKIISIDKKE